MNKSITSNDTFSIQYFSSDEDLSSIVKILENEEIFTFLLLYTYGTEKPWCFLISTFTSHFFIHSDNIQIDRVIALWNSDKIIVFFNAHNTFTYLFKQHKSFYIQNVSDILLAEMLVNNGKENIEDFFSISSIARKYLDKKNIIYKDNTIKPDSFSWCHSNLEREICIHAMMAPSIHTYLLSLLSKQQMFSCYAVECFASQAIAKMESNGIPFSYREFQKVVETKKGLSLSLEQKLSEQAKSFISHDLFGNLVITWDDEKQALNLFRKMGISIEHITKESLSETNHPITQYYHEYRELRHLFSTFIPALESAYHFDSKRIYTHFSPIGASSGRMASSKPNLQNIPAGDLKACIRTEDPYQLITIDYSNCELRILAQMSGEKKLIEIFQKKLDCHSMVASMLFQKPVSKTQNPELRKHSKALHFGLIYGMGTASLAQSLKISNDTAEDLFEKYFTMFPNVKKYLDSVGNQALKTKQLRTLSGRTLFLQSDNLDYHAKSALSRLSKNIPIQGTSADIMKLALGKIHASYYHHQMKSRIIHSVHDEIVIESTIDEAEKACALAKEAMIDAGKAFLSEVSIEVDIHIGYEWGK